MVYEEGYNEREPGNKPESSYKPIQLDRNTSPISQNLLNLFQEFKDFQKSKKYRGSEEPFRTSNDLILLSQDGTQALIKITSSDVEAVLPELLNIGFEVTGSAPAHYFVEGFLPIDSILELERLGLQFQSVGGQTLSGDERSKGGRSTGIVTSQADLIQEAQRVRSSQHPSFDGTGVRVAALSDSYNISGNGSAQADIASGDLPPEGVLVLQEGGRTAFPYADEGRAMLQLVHDLAPGSSLAFSSVLLGEANFADQIRQLANSKGVNADIIVDDFIYLSEPLFQDGVIAQAINEVVTKYGVAYFSAAGNFDKQSYESTKFAAAPDSDGIVIGRFHDFDPGQGVDTRQFITLQPNQQITISLQWDQPFYTTDGVHNNLDIFLLEPGTGNVLSTNSIKAQGINNNLANQTPNENLSFTNLSHVPLDAEIMIRLTEGAEPGRIKYVNYGDSDNKITFNEFGTGSSTINPHAAAVNASAVGAVNYFDQDNPAYYPGKDPKDFFTSVGPTTILFEPKGQRLETPELRLKPDLAAIQGVDTTFFGEDIDGNGFPNFFGTSAAAPHAAAIAALVKQANPDFTPEQIYERLESTAEDIYVPGRDNVTGFGLINAYDAVFGPVVAASPNFVDNFDNGDLPRRYAIDTNGAGRIRVTDSHDPLGSGQVVLDTFLNPAASEKLNPQGSLNELILNINADGASNVILTFDQKEFNDADDSMPDAFTGSFNADGVALSVDGKDWYRLVDLTGVNSTNEYNNNSVNLSEFAFNRGLTLGENVQIKFQQFGNFATPDGGFAFDNIFVTADSHKPHPHHCHESAVYA